MSSGPVSQDPWLDEDPRPVPPWPDWMDDPAYLAMPGAADIDPGDLYLDLRDDPDDAPPPEVDDGELAALRGAALDLAADQERGCGGDGPAGPDRAAIRAADAPAAALGLGPGMPGSAQSFPGVGTPAGRRGSRRVSRWIPRRGAWCWASSRRKRPGPVTGTRAPLMTSCSGDLSAAGTGLRPMPAARRHAAVAELIRRRPAPGCAAQGARRTPEGWSEFTGRELGAVLGVSAGDAEQMLDLAHCAGGAACRGPGRRSAPGC